MQWDTLITSIGGATVVLGALGYILKHSFERVLDAKLKESEERRKAEMAETARRQAALFDKQFGTLQTILELIYRARNVAREIVESEGKAERRTLRRLTTFSEAVQELLYEQR